MNSRLDWLMLSDYYSFYVTNTPPPKRTLSGRPFCVRGKRVSMRTSPSKKNKLNTRIATKKRRTNREERPQAIVRGRLARPRERCDRPLAFSATSELYAP